VALIARLSAALVLALAASACDADAKVDDPPATTTTRTTTTTEEVTP
jgi:hypothetical protein